jgi:hypothetical protein
VRERGRESLGVVTKKEELNEREGEREGEEEE